MQDYGKPKANTANKVPYFAGQSHNNTLYANQDTRFNNSDPCRRWKGAVASALRCVAFPFFLSPCPTHKPRSLLASAKTCGESLNGVDGLECA